MRNNDPFPRYGTQARSFACGNGIGAGCIRALEVHRPLLEITIQLFSGFYFGIILLSILIAAIQYALDRQEAQLAIFLFWSGIALAALANTLLFQHVYLLMLTSPLGTFISQLFLGRFFAQIHGVKVRVRPLLFIFGIGLFTSLVFLALDMEPGFQALPVLLGAVLPVPAHIISVVRQKRRPFSTTQSLFVVASLAMTLHYLDWGFLRARPHLFLYGLGFAIVLYHLLATLLPMIANEAALQERNDHLEGEIKSKAMQLTGAELKLWEAGRIASYGRMAGGMAHEFNTPLQVIEFQTDEIRTLLDADPSATKVGILHGVETIESMVRRLSKITSALRKLSRENLKVPFQTMDIRTIITKAVNAARTEAKTKDTHLSTHLTEEPILVLGDPGELQQVVEELLENAIDSVSTLTIRQVDVDIREKQTAVEVSVTDSGQINPDVASQMMEPFFTTKSIGQGTGLGLSVARSIAENHNGSLYLDRTSSQTRFVLELPKFGTMSS